MSCCGPSSMTPFEQSKADLAKVRTLSVFVVVLHIIVAIGMLVMGFSKQPGEVKFSSSIVFAAFGAMITVIWAGVGAYESFTGTSGYNLPKWEWHSRQFNTAVGVAMTTTGFLVPAVVIFTIHAHNKNLLDILQGKNQDLAGTVVFHGIAGSIVFLTDVVGVWMTSKAMHKLQANSESEQDDQKAMETDLPAKFKVFIVFKLLADGLFVINLINVAFLQGLKQGHNSGSAGSCILSILLMGVFAYRAYRLGRDPLLDWLGYWQFLCILQMAVSYVVTWVALAILVLTSYFQYDFFSTISEKMSTGHRFTVLTLIVAAVLYHLCYAWFLFLHQRCMSALDNMTIHTLKINADELDEDDDDDDEDKE